jgi:hypothetical protein
MNVKRSFNNVRYKDRPRGYDGDATTWSEDVGPTAQRFQEKPIKIEDNYLYTNEEADRFNAGKDFNQQQGQPKGIDFSGREPVTKFESDKGSDEVKKVFVDDLISSFSNGERILSDVLRDQSQSL